MHGAVTVPLVLLLAATGGHALEEQLNPITRVVELMTGLVKKVETDGKAEEDLFDSYVCWYKTVLGTKKASNEAAKDRIESLTAYIDDIQSGRVEFTSERKDLEDEIEKLNSDIESANALRNKESDDYLAAKDEMEKAIAALEEAVDVLGSATSNHSTGVLTSVGFDLRRVVQMGQSMLKKADVEFLERALDGDVPEVDWKKLTVEGGATFKKSYKARSFKIQEILSDMLQTFTDNLADARGRENQAVSTHNTLEASKQSQLSAAQDALSSGDGEAGSRNLNAQEAQDEVDALTLQVSNDQSFISEAEASYAVKVTEWKERKRLRTEEIASISNAIAVLNDDDARDTLHSSFKSQNNLFLQGSAPRDLVAKVSAKLQQLAATHNDMRLAALAISARVTKNHFGKVIQSVEKMISDLNDEYAEDQKTKENCEQERAENTKIAKQNAQNMDDQTAQIARQTALIAEKQKEVESIKAHLSELRLQLEEAQVQRNKENREFLAGKADDEAARALVQRSMDALAKFYDDNSLVLVQSGVHQPPAMTAAGEAPPPPPTTWSAPYGGAKGENNGIQSILQMIKDDMAKDITVNTAAEAKALSDYNIFNGATNSMITSLQSQKATLNSEIGAAEGAVVAAKNMRASKKSILDNTLAALRSIAPSCDFMAANFLVRKANRESEIDGLYEAKALLSGGGFGDL